MSLVREPDAGNLHVRFDERDVETEQGGTTKAPPDERGGNRYVHPTTAAPHLDFTSRRAQIPIARATPYRESRSSLSAWLVDYCEVSGVGLDHYARALHDRAGWTPGTDQLRYGNRFDTQRCQSSPYGHMDLVSQSGVRRGDDA